MQIHFYAEKKSPKRYTIYLKCYINGESVKFYPKIQCEKWDKNEEKALGFNKANINDLLTQLKLKAYDVEHDLKREDRLTKDNFLKLLKNDKFPDFFQAFDEFINAGVSKKSEGTIKQHRAVKNNLLLFDKKEPITFDGIDLGFYDRLVNFFLTECNMSNNTVGHQIQVLKAFLNYQKQRGMNLPIQLSGFKVLREKKEILYHSQDQLEALYTLEIPIDLKQYNDLWHQLYKRDFPGKATLDMARDIHVLECQTSLRVSDRKRLGKQHIIGGVIKMPAHKNKKHLTIPLTPKARAILEKYNYVLPVISEQRMNEYVKALCLVAGFDYLVEQAEYKGGKKIYTKVPRWQLITNHTAVKTFITHCAEKGIPVKVVSEITGKTVKVIQDHYYGTDSKVIEAEMERAFGSSTILKAI